MPNIFEYATSELSQDAMIAWLMACAKADEDEALREVGQSFIRFLLDRPLWTDGSKIERAVTGSDDRPQSYGGEGVVSLIKEVETQYRHVDVYCRAEIDGKLISFVIEDKTGTTQHSGQLERYRKLAQSDKRHEDYLKLIYLKTGMPFSDELDAAERANFCHVGVHELNCFLSSEATSAISSDLLQQYRERIAELANEQEEAELDWNMDCGPVQYRFAKELKQRTRANAGEVIWKWRNRGGGYWTQYRFFGWHLFWRMDTGGHLRMMVDVCQPKPSNVDIGQYQGAFKRACCGVEVKPVEFNFRRGREMTVGAIPYPATEKKDGRVEQKIGERNFDTFLRSIAQIHERFLQEIAKIRADKPVS